MTASREELYHLISELPEDQVQSVAEDLRRRAKANPITTREPFAWFGMIDGPKDLSERFDYYLAEGFGRSRS